MAVSSDDSLNPGHPPATSFLTVVLEMFIFCYGDLMDNDMLGPLVMNSSGLAAKGQSMCSLLLMCNFLVFINTSAGSPEAKNSPNFF